MKQAVSALKLTKLHFGLSAIVFAAIFLVLFAVQHIPAVRDGLVMTDSQTGDIVYANGVESSPAWNATVFVIGFMFVTAFVFGIVTTAYARTYLGAGMTRRNILIYLVLNGLVTVGSALALIGLFWGVTAVIGMPDLEGMGVMRILGLVGSFAMAYLVGTFVCTLFIRYAWWKVLLGFGLVTAFNVTVGLSWGWVQTSQGIIQFSPDTTELLSNMLNALSIPAMLIAIWFMIKTLPIRRS